MTLLFLVKGITKMCINVILKLKLAKMKTELVVQNGASILKRTKQKYAMFLTKMGKCSKLSHLNNNHPQRIQQEEREMLPSKKMDQIMSDYGFIPVTTWMYEKAEVRWINKEAERFKDQGIDTMIRTFEAKTGKRYFCLYRKLTADEKYYQENFGTIYQPGTCNISHARMKQC